MPKILRCLSRFWKVLKLNKNNKMKKLTSFKLKDGREVSIVIPDMSGLGAITSFVNKLSKEDTYLSFAGEEYSLEKEEAWLKNALNEIKFKKNYIVWAVYSGQIIGSVDMKKSSVRSPHVGIIGLFIDRDFRGQGLGRFLLNLILKYGKESGYKIADLNLFSDNLVALTLYKKFGFREWGRLPKGFIRKGKYSDIVKMYKDLK
jgi:RimJ/RimL family protein N-acetyltransferase